MCLCFHVLSYSHTLLIEFKTYTILCSLYIFLVYFNAVRNVLGCWLRDYAPEVTLVDERNTRWGSSFFSWLLKQSASMSKTVRSLYIFTLLKHCSRLYKSAICLCLKVSCRSKYCSQISSRRHHKAQRALFVFEYGRDACASRWAERRRTVNWETIHRQTIQHLIASMPRRCRAVIQANGGHTRYWFSVLTMECLQNQRGQNLDSLIGPTPYCLDIIADYFLTVLIL